MGDTFLKGNFCSSKSTLWKSFSIKSDLIFNCVYDLNFRFNFIVWFDLGTQNNNKTQDKTTLEQTTDSQQQTTYKKNKKKKKNKN